MRWEPAVGKAGSGYGEGGVSGASGERKNNETTTASTDGSSLPHAPGTTDVPPHIGLVCVSDNTPWMNRGCVSPFCVRPWSV